MELARSSKGLIRAKNFDGGDCYCPNCGERVFPKNGIVNIDHFSHFPENCDDKESQCEREIHDPKTDWHIDWQSKRIPYNVGLTIEVPINKGTDKKRADILTKTGIVIEIQHSPLKYNERKIRENHYEKMIWIIHKEIAHESTWHPKGAIILIDHDDENDELLYTPLYDYNKSEVVCKRSWFINEILNGNRSLEDFQCMVSDIISAKTNDLDMYVEIKRNQKISNLKKVHSIKNDTPDWVQKYISIQKYINSKS